jgi:hypothetical protein
VLVPINLLLQVWRECQCSEPTLTNDVWIGEKLGACADGLIGECCRGCGV